MREGVGGNAIQSCVIERQSHLTGLLSYNQTFYIHNKAEKDRFLN